MADSPAESNTGIYAYYVQVCGLASVSAGVDLTLTFLSAKHTLIPGVRTAGPTYSESSAGMHPQTQ